jgi:hypothetical protein
LTYRVDPDDPRAPPQELWERLTPEERARIVDSLPSEFPVSAERRLAEALTELERLRGRS